MSFSRFRSPLLALLPLVFFVIAGCSTPPAGVGLRLVRIEVGDGATVQGTTAVFKLRMQNESIYPLVVDRGSYRIFLNEEWVGEATTREPVGMQDSGTADFSVTVTLATPEQAARLRALVASGRLTYRIECRLSSGQLDSEDLVKIRTTARGTVDLR